MQRIQEKREEIWAESLEILKEIGEISSVNQLIASLNQLQKLQENGAFLKIIGEISENESTPENQIFEPEITDIEDQLDLEEPAIPEPVLEKLDSDYFQNDPVESEEVIEDTPEEEVSVPENAEIALEESKTPQNVNDEEHHKSHKIKLAHIKGLHVESLFDEEVIQQPIQPASASIENSQKIKQDFKLDLNDRMAFSKMLFGGSQSDLNETIRRLNTYRTLDEAKQYLSEVYYDRDWKKADEYAQRLWSLVENKFL